MNEFLVPIGFAIGWMIVTTIQVNRATERVQYLEMQVKYLLERGR